jgi:ATP-binding cassette subfamily B protein
MNDGHISGQPEPGAQSVTDAGGGMDNGAPAHIGLAEDPPIHPRLQAMIIAGRYHGMELDPNEFRLGSGETSPSAASLSAWAQGAGMWARAVRLRWRHLMRFNNTGPVVLLFTDGTAGLLTGVNTEHKVVLVKDPRGSEADSPVPVDELRLSEVWAGEVVLVRANRGYAESDAPFSLRWLVGLVMQEKRSLREIGVASLALSLLTIFPPFLIMTVVDKVLTHHSYSTLTLIGVIVGVAIVYETLLGYGRRLIVLVVGTRIDARLNLHVFNRLLRLPLDYYERHPAGETMYNISQIHRVREFITGRLLSAFLDLMILCVLLPFLFWLNAPLAWIVLACACVIAMIILAFLRPLAVIFGRVVKAETDKQAALGETVFGIRTVKSLALEPQRKAL